MRILGIAVLAALGATVGCGSGKEKPRLDAGGSSFVRPIMSTWASEYDKAKGVEVNYQAIGSGGGIRQLIDGNFDFACTEGPMTDAQMREAGGEIVHIPLVLGAVVPVYNLGEAKEPLRFTGPLLADIFLGKVKKWHDGAIQALNPGLALPDLGITVVYRSDPSSTTFVFTDYLAKVSPDWKQKVGVGTSVKWPVGIASKGSESPGMVVRRTRGAIAFVELTYALHAEMPCGQVRNKAGRFVAPTLGSVTAAADATLADIPDDLCDSLTDPLGKDSYPISGTVWAVARKGKNRAVADFLRWATTEGQKHCAARHYAKLPENLARKSARLAESCRPVE